MVKLVGVALALSLATALADAACSLQNNVEVVGTTLGNKTASQAQDCCTLCQQTKRCNAFTWTSKSNGTCTLKSTQGKTKSKKGAVSGTLSNEPTVTPSPTSTSTSKPTPSSATVGKAIADYMVKTWPVDKVGTDTSCGSKCLSLDYSKVPAVSSPKGWEYTYGVAIDALWKLFEKTGDTKYFDYVKGFVDIYGFDSSTNRLKISESQDRMQPMVLLPGVYNKTQDARYLTAMADARAGIDAFKKNPSGAFWHKPNYPNQQWLDGLYMTEPFLAEYAAKYADQVKPGDATAAFNIVAEQFKIAHEHLYNATTKLHYHAWLESSDMVWNGLSRNAPVTGLKRTEFFWGRSVGWYYASLMDVLEFIPKTHADRAKLEEIASLLSEGLAKQQDAATGLWYQILDVRNDNLPANGGYPNESIPALPNWLETSASALFTYGFAKGVRIGVLPRQYQAVAKKGWQGVVSKVEISGSEVIVKGTIAGMGVGATYNAYVNADFRSDVTTGAAPAPAGLCSGSVPKFSSPPKECKYVYVRDNVPQGIGAVMLASIEMEYA